jgi:IS4 transposase
VKGLEQLKKSNNKKMRGKVSALQELYNRSIVVATSFEDEASAQGVLELYRMRWQIELVFKRLKTLFHYNEIASKLDDSACSWFYGKLLLSAVCEAFVNKGRFSPCEGI